MSTWYYSHSPSEFTRQVPKYAGQPNYVIRPLNRRLGPSAYSVQASVEYDSRILTIFVAALDAVIAAPRHVQVKKKGWILRAVQ